VIHVSPVDPSQLAGIPPERIIRYLKYHDWKEVADTGDEEFIVYSRSVEPDVRDEPRVHVHLPDQYDDFPPRFADAVTTVGATENRARDVRVRVLLSEEYDDYPLRLADAVMKIAATENRTTDAVVAELLLGAKEMESIDPKVLSSYLRLHRWARVADACDDRFEVYAPSESAGTGASDRVYVQLDRSAEGYWERSAKAVSKIADVENRDPNAVLADIQTRARRQLLARSVVAVSVTAALSLVGLRELGKTRSELDEFLQESSSERIEIIGALGDTGASKSLIEVRRRLVDQLESRLRSAASWSLGTRLRWADSGAEVEHIVRSFEPSRADREAQLRDARRRDEIEASLRALCKTLGASETGIVVDLSELDLSNLDLVGEGGGACLFRRVDFSRSNLGHTQLGSAALNRAQFRQAHLAGVGLRGADLREVEMSLSMLRDADLQACRLSNAALDRSLLAGADLRHCDLHRASLRNADLTGAMLEEANIRGADLTGAVGLTAEQVRSAMFDERTLLPESLALELNRAFTTDVLTDNDFTEPSLEALRLRRALEICIDSTLSVSP